MMNATPASPIAKPKAKLSDHLPPLTLLGPLVALVLACIFFISQTPRFLSVQNLSLILQQSMVVGIIAIGQTLIVLTAGIDLSCGMVMALGSVVMSKVAVANGINPFISILLGVAVCTLFGLINGLLVTRVKLPAFIVTLGTLNIAFAITQIYSNAESISNLPAPLTFFGNTFGIGAGTVTFGTVLMLLLYLLTWFVLRETAPGRHVYAIGNNAEAVRLMGLPTQRILITIYTLAGLSYGIAALLAVARTGVGDPQSGQTENLDSITAVVLGGTSLFGGRGTMMGTLLGVLIVGVFRNGLTLIGVSSVYQVLVTGILVILAVSADKISHR
ncbi:ABC transporter permease [Pararobbsia alpina]|uniref:ABC transporter permease n=1 Tax=Pararobbsia alpina TaxID=621374 RepID=UPI0039A77114